MSSNKKKESEIDQRRPIFGSVLEKVSSNITPLSPIFTTPFSTLDVPKVNVQQRPTRGLSIFMQRLGVTAAASSSIDASSIDATNSLKIKEDVNTIKIQTIVKNKDALLSMGSQSVRPIFPAVMQQLPVTAEQNGTHDTDDDESSDEKDDRVETNTEEKLISSFTSPNSQMSKSSIVEVSGGGMSNGGVDFDNMTSTQRAFALEEVKGLLSSDTILKWTKLREQQHQQYGGMGENQNLSTMSPQIGRSGTNVSSSSSSSSFGQFSSSSRTLDLSAIQDEASLDAAAMNLLSSTEKDKLAWTRSESENSQEYKDIVRKKRHDNNRRVKFNVDDEDDDNDDDENEEEEEEEEEEEQEETEYSSSRITTIGGNTSSSSYSSSFSSNQTLYGSGTSQFFTAWAESLMIEANEEEKKDETEDKEETEELEETNDLFTTDTIGREISKMRHALGLPSLSSSSHQGFKSKEGQTLSFSTHFSLTRLRFDLQGHLIIPLKEFEARTEGIDTRELFHHGTDSTRPGYTLIELLGLTRSAVAAQRSVAWRALALLLKRRREAFISSIAPGCTMTTSTSATLPVTDIQQLSWQYKPSEWALESKLLRSLLLPPVLPAMLRSAADETSLSCLIPGLDALIAFATPLSTTSDTPPYTPFSSSSSSSSTSSLSWSNLSAGWYELSPPVIRSQPPTEDEGDWTRLTSRHSATQINEEENEEPLGIDIETALQKQQESQQNTHTNRNLARIALRDGRDALRDPMTVLCAEGPGRMALLQRLCVILSNLSLSNNNSGSSSLSSSIDASISNDAPSLRVVQQCVILFRAAAHRSLSLADLIARRLFVTIPVGRVGVNDKTDNTNNQSNKKKSTNTLSSYSPSTTLSTLPRVKVGVLQYLFKAFISPLCIDRDRKDKGENGDNCEDMTTTGKRDRQAFNSFLRTRSLRHSLGSNLISLLRVIVQQGRGLAADLCDEPDPNAINAPQTSTSSSLINGREDEGSWSSSSSSFSARNPGTGLGPPLPPQALARGRGEFGTVAVAMPLHIDSLIHLLPLSQSDHIDLLSSSTSVYSPWFHLQSETLLLLRVCNGYGLATLLSSTLLKRMFPLVSLWNNSKQENRVTVSNSPSFTTFVSPSPLDAVLWIILDLCIALLSAASAEAESLSRSLPRSSLGSDVAYSVSDTAHLSAQSVSIMHRILSILLPAPVVSRGSLLARTNDLQDIDNSTLIPILNASDTTSISIASQIMRMWCAHLSRVGRGEGMVVEKREDSSSTSSLIDYNIMPPGAIEMWGLQSDESITTSTTDKKNDKDEEQDKNEEEENSKVSGVLQSRASAAVSREFAVSYAYLTSFFPFLSSGMLKTSIEWIKNAARVYEGFNSISEDKSSALVSIENSSAAGASFLLSLCSLISVSVAASPSMALRLLIQCQANFDLSTVKSSLPALLILASSTRYDQTSNIPDDILHSCSGYSRSSFKRIFVFSAFAVSGFITRSYLPSTPLSNEKSDTSNLFTLALLPSPGDEALAWIALYTIFNSANSKIIQDRLLLQIWRTLCIGAGRSEQITSGSLRKSWIRLCHCVPGLLHTVSFWGGSNTEALSSFMQTVTEQGLLSSGPSLPLPASNTDNSNRDGIKNTTSSSILASPDWPVGLALVSQAPVVSSLKQQQQLLNINKKNKKTRSSTLNVEEEKISSSFSSQPLLVRLACVPPPVLQTPLGLPLNIESLIHVPASIALAMSGSLNGLLSGGREERGRESENDTSVSTIEIRKLSIDLALGEASKVAWSRLFTSVTNLISESILPHLKMNGESVGSVDDSGLSLFALSSSHQQQKRAAETVVLLARLFFLLLHGALSNTSFSSSLSSSSFSTSNIASHRHGLITSIQNEDNDDMTLSSTLLQIASLCSSIGSKVLIGHCWSLASLLSICPGLGSNTLLALTDRLLVDLDEEGDLVHEEGDLVQENGIRHIKNESKVNAARLGVSILLFQVYPSHISDHQSNTYTREKGKKGIQITSAIQVLLKEHGESVRLSLWRSLKNSRSLVSKIYLTNKEVLSAGPLLGAEFLETGIECLETMAQLVASLSLETIMQQYDNEEDIISNEYEFDDHDDIKRRLLLRISMLEASKDLKKDLVLPLSSVHEIAIQLIQERKRKTTLGKSSQTKRCRKITAVGRAMKSLAAYLWSNKEEGLSFSQTELVRRSFQSSDASLAGLAALLLA
jgi:hypothetical protein